MNRAVLSIPGIIDLASAYYGSAVLFAALEVDAFTAVQKVGAGATCAALAQQAGTNARGMRLLLDACVALGLLEKTGDVYANTPASAMTLVSGAPYDLTRAIRYNRDVYPAWGRAVELVRTGHPVEAPEIHLGETPSGRAGS